MKKSNKKAAASGYDADLDVEIHSFGAFIDETVDENGDTQKHKVKVCLRSYNGGSPKICIEGLDRSFRNKSVRISHGLFSRLAGKLMPMLQTAAAHKVEQKTGT